MTRGSSGMLGNVAARDPAAMMQLSNEIVRSPTSIVCGPVSRASPWTTSTSRCRASSVKSPGELSDHRLLPLPERVDVDLRPAEADAVRCHLLGLGHDARRVQQRLRRDAADVQAHAAEALVALDQDRLQPEVGGAERGRVATDARSEDHHLRVVRSGPVGLGRRRRQLYGRHT